MIYCFSFSKSVINAIITQSYDCWIVFCDMLLFIFEWGKSISVDSAFIHEEISKVTIIEERCSWVINFSFWIENKLSFFWMELSSKERIIFAFHRSYKRNTVIIVWNRCWIENWWKAFIWFELIWTHTPWVMIISDV